MPRRALLLAIADYDSLPRLDYVARDIPRMREGLSRAGYLDIVSVGAGSTGTARELTTMRLRDAIDEFLESAGADDDLIVFFSGHGAELEGRRLLLPQDYNPQRARPDDAVVSDAWISRAAHGCAARSVIVLIDACREGARFKLAATKSQESADAPLRGEYLEGPTDAPSIAFFYSCNVGEQSGIEYPGLTCSAFTKAFAEAIEREKGPSQLTLIAEDARHLLLSYSRNTQVLVVTGRDGRGQVWQHLVLKQDESALFRERLGRSDWAQQLAQTGLFAKVHSALPSFAIQLQAIAMRAEERVARAEETLPLQHWRGSAAVCLRRAQCVLHLARDWPKQLSPAEMAVLLAVPFVYEVALATAEAHLAYAGALPDPMLSSSSSPLANAWRAAWQEGDAAATCASLITRGRPQAAQDFAYWTLIVFCHGSGELWDAGGGENARSGWAADAIAAVLAPAPLPEVAADPRITEILDLTRMLRLARLSIGGFDDVTLDAGARLEQQVCTGERERQLVINEVRLAHTLNLAARLALDPRRMPPVLAEHVGADDNLSARWIGKQLARAEWHARTPEQGAAETAEPLLDLGLQCANDAMDAALLSEVDALENYRTRLLQRQDVHAESMRGMLPAGFTTRTLNALSGSWQPTRPPLRFELDRTRIIHLLMGEKLYGDSWPALRELYQNALDACRYRRAAEQLLREQGGAAAAPYQGRIHLHFGTENGRRYVACTDNGIGMADRHIRQLFACAGQRFSDSHEFHIDRARWEAAGIAFFKNSRFGIGVLSYFMLAEELDVTSCRWAPPGERGAEAVRAGIVGTGSLFRLGTGQAPARLIDRYGTSVRLYLRTDAPEHEKLWNSVLIWLAIPELPVELSRDDGMVLKLPPGQPTDAFRAASGGVLLPVVASESSLGFPRIFLAPMLERRRGLHAEPMALVDGIVTKSDDCEWPQIVIANLTEALRAEPTVDRRSVVVSEVVAQTIRDGLLLGAAKALSGWEEATFEHFHQSLTDLGWEIADDVDTQLRSGRHPATTAVLTCHGSTQYWPIGRAGVNDLDVLIAADLVLLSAKDMPAYRFGADLVLEGRVAQVLMDRAENSPTSPFVASEMLARTLELVAAKMELPLFLVQAANCGARAAHGLPARCHDVLWKLNGGQLISLPDAVRWQDSGHRSYLNTIRKIAAGHSKLVTFDWDKFTQLQLLHAALVRLCYDSKWDWLTLAYFMHEAKISRTDALSIAEDLYPLNIVGQLAETCPTDLALSETEFKNLELLHQQTSNSIFLRDFKGDHGRYAHLELWGGLTRTLTRFYGIVGDEEDNGNTDDLPPETALTWLQRWLLSRDLDGEPPFLDTIPMQHIVKAVLANKSQLSASEVITSAAALRKSGVAVSDFSTEQANALASLEGFRQNKFIDRIACSAVVGFSVSLWDFSLFCAANHTEPTTLSMLVDTLDMFGWDVAECRDFIAFRSRIPELRLEPP